jgi:cobalt/nickel transport system permease protein
MGAAPGGLLGLDGRCALVAALAGILVTILTPPGRWPLLGGEAALVAAALAWLRPPPRWLLRRLAVLLPFMLMAVASLAFARTGPAPLSPWERAAGLAARMLISFGALAALLRAVGPSELLAALGRLRVPAIFVSVGALMLRYLDLLEEEAARMLRARDCRGTAPTVRQRAGVAGAMVGTLFVRSFERAERVSLAMQARGFTGLLPPPAPRPLRAADALFLAGALLAQAALAWATA